MSSENKNKARPGRPRKIITPGSEEIKFSCPADVAAYIRASAALSGEKYVGSFITNAVYAYADLLPRVEQMAADMDENRAMLAEILAGQRVLITKLMDIERANMEEEIAPSSNPVSPAASIEDGQF